MVPNCVAKPKGEKRSYVCEEIHTIKDISSLTLRRPVDRGYVVNWDLQREILDHVFKKVLKINPKTCHLVLTEAPFNLPAIAAEQDKAIFDHFGFKSALICNPAGLIPRASRRRRRRRVEGRASGRRRRLRVLLRPRHANLRRSRPQTRRATRQHWRQGAHQLSQGAGELSPVEHDGRVRVDGRRQGKVVLRRAERDGGTQARESARPGERDQQRVRASRRGTRHARVRQKRAPRGTRTRRRATTTTPARALAAARKKSGGGGGKRRRLSGEGVVKGSTFVEQTLGMGNERFMVPEVLFHPSDIGLNQAGIAEAAAQAVRSVQSDLRGMLFANVVLAGGCASLPGFKERFEAELRPFVPAEDELVVTLAEDPAEMAWRGGSVVGAGADFRAARRHARGVPEGPGGVSAEV